jgi:hypothetical protein
VWSTASAPGSHSASSVGLTPGAHAAKAPKRRTSTYRDSAAAVRSVSVGGFSALSSSFTCSSCVSSARSSVHAPATLHVTPSAHSRSPAEHTGDTSTVRFAEASTPALSVTT